MTSKKETHDKSRNITRAGVIDIGSSSIKLTIGEKAGEDLKVLEFLKTAVPIGAHTFFRQRISQETINQTVGILNGFKRALKEYEVEKVFIIATTAVREAKNRDIFIDTVMRKTGLAIEILTVGDVIFYIDSYLSEKLKDTYPIHDKNLLIAELGAGSLDISLMEKGFTLMNLGLPIGTLRLKQLMNKLDGSFEEIVEAVREYVGNEFSYLKRVIPKMKIDDVILIDETYSYYLQNILPDKKIGSNFFQLGVADSEEVLERLSQGNVRDTGHSCGIPPEISETITEYAVLLRLLFPLAGKEHIHILETALSEAILANILLDLEISKKYNKNNQLISTAEFICRKYGVDTEHARHVAHLSGILFERLKDHLGFSENDLLYLALASHLHDIGSFIHNRAHHKHTEYVIGNLNLFRLSDEEMKMIACIARYHRKAPPLRSHLLYSSLPYDKQILVQKMGALLRISNSLDCSHKQKVKRLEVKFRRSGDIALVIHTLENFVLEKADFMEKKELFEEITGDKISLAIKNPV